MYYSYLAWNSIVKVNPAHIFLTHEFSLRDGPIIYAYSRNSPEKILSYVCTGFLKYFLSLSLNLFDFFPVTVIQDKVKCRTFWLRQMSTWEQIVDMTQRARQALNITKNILSTLIIHVESGFICRSCTLMQLLKAFTWVPFMQMVFTKLISLVV